MDKRVRQTVYEKYDGHCAYCGKEIKLNEMQVDHIHPQMKGGGDDEDNLNPSCRKCNFYKTTFDIETFREQLKTIHERLLKPFIVRIAMDYGIIKIEPWDGKFYFEKVSST